MLCILSNRCKNWKPWPNFKKKISKFKSRRTNYAKTIKRNINVKAYFGLSSIFGKLAKGSNYPSATIQSTTKGPCYAKWFKIMGKQMTPRVSENLQRIWRNCSEELSWKWSVSNSSPFSFIFLCPFLCSVFDFGQQNKKSINQSIFTLLLYSILFQ